MSSVLPDLFQRKPIVLPYGKHLPEEGLLRLRQIIGDPKAAPPVPPIIPVSKSTWWDGVRKGRYPKPVKNKLGPRITAWDVRDIRKLIADAAGGA